MLVSSNEGGLIVVPQQFFLHTLIQENGELIIFLVVPQQLGFFLVIFQTLLDIEEW